MAILRTMNNAANKKATKTLTGWLKNYVTARGCLPSIGISMFAVPGLGTAVRCTVTGLEIAHFSDYEAASLGVARAEASVRPLVATYAADSI